MTSFLGIHSLSKSFGTQVLFKDLSFTICQGDRVGLIGPNGSGKSTLFKIMAGLDSPDEGYISVKQGLRIGYASQSPEFPDATLEEVLVAAAPSHHTETLTQARILLGKAQFKDSFQKASALSGGWKKRLDILRALMKEPDLLLLDEPTNHLDLEGILWLEDFLKREKISYMVISHDRYFLENISNKILELNRCFPGGIFSSDGSMSDFMERKEAFLEGQEQQQRGLANLVKEEQEWLRRSPKARTVKSQSRVQRAYTLIEELHEIQKRNEKPKVGLDFIASERETRKLLVAKNISKTLGDKVLFKGIDLTLSPGTRLGIVGKNGTGKTSLLRILAKMLPPDMGTVKYADDLKLVYFDQHREQIPPNVTLREALSPHSDRVNYRGNLIHVNGWAKRFLFSPDRLELPVHCLSGGEKARILIARLMLEPADILFLDEPTNDLDIPTLEVIEESLKEFRGAVVLITHDRCLMDRLCNQIIGLGCGLEKEIFADYNQWDQAEKSSRLEMKKQVKQLESSSTALKTKKLSYNEQRELAGMEERITAIEREIEAVQKEIEETSGTMEQLELYKKLSAAQEQLEKLYKRWQELEKS